MSESIWEQMAYGDHCVHGTSIGTPSGADLMCGLCESNLTAWVDDPAYELRLRVSGTTIPLRSAVWRESQIGLADVGQRVGQAIVNAFRFLRVATIDISNDVEWCAFKTDSGYWMEPCDIDSHDCQRESDRTVCQACGEPLY